MLTYPNIDPVALSLGPVQLHWYGISYLVGFLIAWGLARYRAANNAVWRTEMVDDLVFYSMIGVILGGRIGYIIFYGFEQVIADPLSVFRVWEGGMSFHGGLLGVLAAMYFVARRYKLGFWTVSDFMAPLIPPGLFAGRMGNFINGELWGARTDSFLGMQLPCSRFPEQCIDQLPNTVFSPAVHPSQLYEGFLEGIVLFLILWFYSRKPRPTMAVSGLFLLGYGIFRFSIEFVRLPDPQLGYLAFGWVTMGQILSMPMILFGALLLILAYRRQVSA